MLVFLMRRGPPRSTRTTHSCPTRRSSDLGLGPSERRLGINDPALFADRREVPQESASFGKMREAAKESELAVIVQRAQPGQEQPAEEGTKHADREQEGWAC